MGSPPSEAKVELGRQCDRHTHSSLRVCKLRCRRHQARGAHSFRWLHRRGSTRSHPEHGSQALQSRWYCTLCVWESRSLPEFFSKTPRRSPRAAGRRLFSTKNVVTQSSQRAQRKASFRKTKLCGLCELCVKRF